MTREEAEAELGVSGRASQATIRAAFKRLALRHHPDHNPGQTQAAARFHRICVAYEILRGARAPAPSPPAAQRKRNQRPRWRRSSEPLSPPPRPEKWPSGEPIYYPTPEEIAALDAPRTGGSRRAATVFLLLVASGLGVLALIRAMAERSPTPLELLNQKSFLRHR